MKKDEILKDYDQYILSTYRRNPVVFVKGKGMTLTDVDGKKYLDFFPGWGVSNVGHCHPKVVSAVRDQIDKLIHLPNNFYHAQQVKLAKEIIRHAFPGKVFYCNSGAEGIEAAIKFTRVFGKSGGRHKVIAMNNSFHGRTLGALAATGQQKYQQGFDPLPQGFVHVELNDLEALKKNIDNQTVGILLELVQGEGGIRVADKDYVKEVRRLCDHHRLILIIDEVQTGIGRTGEMFAFKHYGITPDIMILAKSLGGGLPMGAVVAGPKIAELLQPGMHASTFGGSPLVCKAALGVFAAITKDGMLKNVRTMGAYLVNELQKLKKQFSCIKEIRGLGLMVGIELNREGKGIFEACLDEGLIINCTQDTVLRLMPALNVTKKQIHKALFILEKVLRKGAQDA